MNILFLCPYIPYPPGFGGAVRIYHLMRQLAHNHSVTLLSYYAEGGKGDVSGMEEFCAHTVLVEMPSGNKRVEQLKSLFGRRSYQWNANYCDEMQAALDKCVADFAIDVIVVEFSQMACFTFPAGVPVVIDEHNVEYDLLRRMALRDGLSLRKVYNLIEASKFQREEVAAVRDSALTLVTSTRDEALLKESVADLRTAVITNGVDVAHFKRPDGPRKPDTAVFVGATHYFPNEEGIHFFMRDMIGLIRQERPDFRFVIVGGKPPPSILEYQSDSVIVTGYVDDVRPYMWESSVFVVPLRMGGGTRFKIVEALAAGIPVVSTRLGAEGIPVTHGREVMLGDTPADFARGVVDILASPEKAESLIRTGLTFVKEYFDWSVIGGNLEKALAALVR